MKSTEIRRLWKEFWETKAPVERKHAWSQPASLIVNSAEDPTTMFNTAGMQPLVPYLMGKEHPSGKRLYNIQWCVRTTDIDEVGDASHLTIFEMMWNWSLGDYFKKQSIAWSREFLTQWLKLDPNYLAVTVFEWDEDAPRDEESVQYWKEQWVPEHRIAYLGKDDNRWGPAWQTWPCGTDTEIFYWIGSDAPPPKESNPANDEDNWLEIWNNVFMAYYKDDAWVYSELQHKNVDTGMWFERICLVTQCQNWMITTPLKEASVYDIDVFVPILSLLEAHMSEISRKRIFADHARASLWLIQEWLLPSNEWRGYVLRRLIRRMYFQWYMSTGRSLNDTNYKLFEQVMYHIKEHLNDIYDGIFTNQVVTLLFQEVKRFGTTLQQWEKLLHDMLTQETSHKVVSWEQVFTLYDTHGFPVDLTREIAQENWWTTDDEWFEEAMERAQELSRQWSKDMFAKNVDRASFIDDVLPTKFVWYDELEVEWVQLLKDFEVEWQRVLVFNSTPFYAEWGGQTWDTWTVVLDNGEFLHVKDVQKYGGVWLHFVA